MSNIVSIDAVPAIADLQMSNGMTSVFLSVLLLSGSDLAHTDWEVATIAWFADRDASIVGLGIIGFDIAELGWRTSGFDDQQRFLRSVVDAAANRHRWEALSYAPEAAAVSENLRVFGTMIEHFPAAACRDGRRDTWSTAGVRTDRACCPRHGVLLHNLRADDAECCLICNDEPLP